MTNGTPLPGIEHVVVLMLENRSFDNVLGGLGPSYPAGTDFEGVPAGWSNPNTHHDAVAAWQDDGSNPPYTTTPDPGESFDDMTHQLFGYDALNLPHKPVGVPDMQGFCINYEHHHRIKGEPETVMHYFNPTSVPVSSNLALAYGCSDQWFAAAPNQTYPNRVFTHCGTPGLESSTKAYVDDTNYFHGHIPTNVNKAYGVITDPCVFQAIDEAYANGGAKNWKVYYHDTPLSALVDYVSDRWGAMSCPCANKSTQVVAYDDSDCGASGVGTTFAADVAAGSLPKYAFIEPRYYANWSKNNLAPNSNHPGPGAPALFGHGVVKNGDLNSDGPNNKQPISVVNGELLLLDVYWTLASNPTLFDKTLLIVTYDEHGGMFDHVAPPTATSPFPDPGSITNFAFDRYGVRVPTLLINPRIAGETIVRATGATPLDHTSIIRTLYTQFGLTWNPSNAAQPQLTPRDGGAPDLTSLLTLGSTRTDLPDEATLRGSLPSG